MHWFSLSVELLEGARVIPSSETFHAVSPGAGKERELKGERYKWLREALVLEDALVQSVRGGAGR